MGKKKCLLYNLRLLYIIESRRRSHKCLVFLSVIVTDLTQRKQSREEQDERRDYSAN